MKASHEYDFIPSYNAFVDYLYGILLRLFSKRKNSFDDESLKKIKAIDESANSLQEQKYRDINTLKEFTKLLGCGHLSQVDFLFGDEYYFLCIRHYNCIEIEELTSATGKCTDIFKIINYLEKKYKNKQFYSFAKEETVYKIYLALHKRKRLIILTDYAFKHRNMPYHALRFRFNI